MGTPEGIDQEVELSLKLFVVLSRTLQSIQKQSEKDIKGYGLNKTEFGVLELLYHKGNHPIQNIGKKLLLASSSITYVIDQLEKKNLIKRKASPKDRRMTYASITKKGHNLMDDIFPEHKKALHDIFRGLNMDEKTLMISQLKKLGFHAESL